MLWIVYCLVEMLLFHRGRSALIKLASIWRFVVYSHLLYFFAQICSKFVCTEEGF